MAKKRVKTERRIVRSRSAMVRADGAGLDVLVEDLRSLIERAKQEAGYAVNSALVMLYWQIGRRIREDLLKQRRAEYGQQILSTLSKELTAEYGEGFSIPNLSRMIRLAEMFPKERIISTLSKQLSWSHFLEILGLKGDLQREFYAEMTRLERWSVRTLRQKIAGMLFERTAIAKKPDQLARKELAALREQDQVTPDLVFRDPYLLGFLGLKGAYSEKDLESAILRDLETFILELGAGFSFVARQKRITVDDEDYYIDLLFFHRKLRRLVAIDLKLGRFQAADKGQMELYLRWLDRYERQPSEEAPIGLILCAGKSTEHVELLELERSGIRVAAYLTDLPTEESLRKKLHQAIRAARARLETRAEPRPDKEE